MSEYLIEVYTTGADQAVGDAERLGRSGGEVHVVRTIFVPDDETCFYLLSGQSEEAVRDAATRSGLQVERVVAAVSSTGGTR